MIDSKFKPQPGEGRGINTINQKLPGLQKEEPGASLLDRDPDFECLKEREQVRTRTTEVLERDCGPDIKVAGCRILWVLGLVTGGEGRAGLVLEA